MHDSLDYAANGTCIVCNPWGYVTSVGADNPEFDSLKIVEI